MIVDDHEVVRRGIAEIVDRAEGLVVVAEASSVAEALRRAELVRPEVILVDLQLPDGPGIDIIKELATALLPLVERGTGFGNKDGSTAGLLETITGLRG